MLLVTQGWGLLPSQYFQTSCSPLLPPVLPFTVCMFLNWQSRQVTLKTSSQNMYWGKRMVESLFFLFICFTTTPQGEQKQTGQKVGDSLACYCFYRQAWQASRCAIHPLKPPDSTVGKSLIFPGIFFPSIGSLAWLPEENIKPKDRLEFQNELGLILPEHFSWNISAFAISSILLFLLFLL